ncbi:hypothetical protein [Agrococcus sp. Ld7]|uniref:hypothetical protein n=1 Tax=Agrococcus sp. Ld7 TaxID=649148 RepID=UPI003862F874
MLHLSDDAITALALGAPSDRSAHLERCGACADDVSSLRRTAERVRRALAEPADPPAAVWERILREVVPHE